MKAMNLPGSTACDDADASVPAPSSELPDSETWRAPPSIPQPPLRLAERIALTLSMADAEDDDDAPTRERVVGTTVTQTDDLAGTADDELFVDTQPCAISTTLRSVEAPPRLRGETHDAGRSSALAIRRMEPHETPHERGEQELPPGFLLKGRYSVDRLIGRGSMSAVYAVRHLNTGEALALKVLAPAFADDPQALQRFLNEARAPLRIGTEHVVRVLDADISEELDAPFLVMERLLGRDLEAEVAERGPLGADEVNLYMKQVGQALGRAHALGIVHRDLKPANLYLTRREDGSPLVKILDFGVAWYRNVSAAERTREGTLLGTPQYMSPEQIQGHISRIGPATDSWALGMTVFRLLTGASYWRSNELPQLMAELLHEPMAPPSQRSPRVGPRFDAWFARACDRDPARRFPTVGALSAELEEALDATRGPRVHHASFPSLDIVPCTPPWSVGAGTAPALSRDAPPWSGAFSEEAGAIDRRSTVAPPLDLPCRPQPVSRRWMERAQRMLGGVLLAAASAGALSVSLTSDPRHREGGGARVALKDFVERFQATPPQAAPPAVSIAPDAAPSAAPAVSAPDVTTASAPSAAAGASQARSARPRAAPAASASEKVRLIEQLRPLVSSTASPRRTRD
jgi:serine/threonine protein kinase